MNGKRIKSKMKYSISGFRQGKALEFGLDYIDISLLISHKNITKLSLLFVT